jgi:hypothetical protein
MNSRSDLPLGPVDERYGDFAPTARTNSLQSMVSSEARERLNTCPSAESLHDLFSWREQLVWRDPISSDKVAIDHLEITLVVVATTATGNRAHIDECPTEWNHLQVLVSVAGRR